MYKLDPIRLFPSLLHHSSSCQPSTPPTLTSTLPTQQSPFHTYSHTMNNSTSSNAQSVSSSGGTGASSGGVENPWRFVRPEFRGIEEVLETPRLGREGHGVSRDISVSYLVAEDLLDWAEQDRQRSRTAEDSEEKRKSKTKKFSGSLWGRKKEKEPSITSEMTAAKHQQGRDWIRHLVKEHIAAPNDTLYTQRERHDEPTCSTCHPELA